MQRFLGVRVAKRSPRYAPTWMGRGAVDDIIASIRAAGPNPIKLAFNIGRELERRRIRDDASR